ncbi:hypothetical protein C4900_06905 [Acidiferrobacter thiooxydans]|uniref:Uncharacterized protein n=1 Tax=Acidiferrobacter thiooxydans TaxID=163359 RepID=A0A368HN12_9GAMM|nr:hypothetical protein C4900_06905 [Acidiferrobacter thiooxydans]
MKATAAHGVRTLCVEGVRGSPFQGIALDIVIGEGLEMGQFFTGEGVVCKQMLKASLELQVVRHRVNLADRHDLDQ